MKLLIASDIHGDFECAERLVGAYRASGADKMLLLGDILYHGPRNDLPAGYAPKKVIELLNSIKDELLCVRGNCDTEVDQMVLEFPILADYAHLELDGLSVLATHGHKFSVSAPPPLKKGDIMLGGHTHVPAVENFGNGNTYINPGSVSIPKNGSEKSYIIYENREFVFHTLGGAIYDGVSF
ncbi:MAG: phosphodiesterase [Clostridia bacterium]|nr:phosphodiesterase [Clostridia bacterium]